MLEPFLALKFDLLFWKKVFFLQIRELKICQIQPKYFRKKSRKQKKKKSIIIKKKNILKKFSETKNRKKNICKKIQFLKKKLKLKSKQIFCNFLVLNTFFLNVNVF